MSPLSVWHVARESAGLAEAGGVKDVVRGLAEAQARAGLAPVVVLPRYGFMRMEELARSPVASFTVSLPDHDRGNQFFPEPVQVQEALVAGVRLLLVESPRYSALRDVYTYTPEDEQENHWKKKGTGHWDTHQLNVLLQRAVLETALALGSAPDVLHCHDGHTAFLPAMARELPEYQDFFRATSSVVTIHNAGKGYHQEIWDPSFASLLTGLPAGVIEKGLLDKPADPFLLAGSYATLVTVSEQYAKELISEASGDLSGGLGKALRDRGIPLQGITNGIDPGPWDPRTPERSGIPFGFDPSNGDLAGKARCRQELFSRLGVAQPPGRAPVYAFVGRLTGQKGIDVLFESLKAAVRGPADRRFVVLGTGVKEMEAMVAWLAADGSSAGRLSFLPRYDPSLASLIYAASDFFLIPSAYEPCGLTDFIAQIMGSIPVVHRVGGLVKVRDGETGFSYEQHSPQDLTATIERTTRIFAEQPSVLDTIRRTAFREIFERHTWDHVWADSYLRLYQASAAEGQWTHR